MAAVTHVLLAASLLGAHSLTLERDGPGATCDMPRMQRWVEAAGSMIYEGVHVEKVDKNGALVRGLVASDDIKKGRKVAELSESIMLSRRHPLVMRSSFKDTDEMLCSTSRCSVVFYLADQFRRVRDGLQSFWEPWVNCMPTAEEFASYHPRYADGETLEPFQDLEFVQKLKLQNETLYKTWAEYCNKTMVDVPFEDVKRAALIFDSRTFPSDHGNHKNPDLVGTLIPFVDLVSMRIGKKFKYNDANMHLDKRFRKTGPRNSGQLHFKTLQGVRRGEPLALFHHDSDSDDARLLRYGAVQRTAHDEAQYNGTYGVQLNAERMCEGPGGRVRRVAGKQPAIDVMLMGMAKEACTHSQV